MLNEEPTVSVVIPTYNREHLIGKSIQSVLDQTYKDFEIIVVDDGSSDNTKEVIKSFADARIRYVRHQQNKGGNAARNTGIELSRGEYIAFQDSDDEWLPEKLEKQMKVFGSALADVGVVYTRYWKIENDEKIDTQFSWVKQKEGNIHKELLKGNFVTTSSMVVRKECFEKAGVFDERLPRAQEWELVIRFSKYYNFECIDEPLLISYCTPDSISANDKALIDALLIIIQKHFNEFTKDKELLSTYYCTIGIYICSNGDFKRGRGYLIKAVKIYPLNIKLLLITFISFVGEGMYLKAMKVYRKIWSV